MAEFIIPKRIQVETVFGCNARCKMCPVNMPTKRKKGVMSLDFFKRIVDQMEPYKNSIKLFDLWGVGEPLLDNTLFEKIKYAKGKGFRNLAIASNLDLMNEEKQNQLLKSKIDSIICGIDGINKETHESLRLGVNFDNIIGYVKSIINKRNTGDYKTRFIIRFVKQKANIDQWEEYQRYWKSLLSPEKGDMIIGYDIRSWDKEVFSADLKFNKEINKLPCHHVWDRLVILLDGTVPMCCGDFHNANYPVGNMNDTPLIKIFNSDKYNEYRKIHAEGRKNTIPICKECSILYSEAKQERWNDDSRYDWRIFKNE